MFAAVAISSSPACIHKYHEQVDDSCAYLRVGKIETGATSDSGRFRWLLPGRSYTYTVRLVPYIKASEQTRGSSMTMRHGEHSATVDPGVRGVIPSFSHRSPPTPLAARHRRPLARLFLPPPPLPFPLSSAIHHHLFRSLSSSFAARRYRNHHARFTSSLSPISLLSLPYFSPLSLGSSGKRRAAMYLPGGTTYVNLPHYIPPG